VWSVGHEFVEVYLGTRTVLVQRRHHPLLRYFPAPTQPLSDVLLQIDEECHRSESKPWRIHVTLTAQRCRALGLSLPSGIQRWSDVFAIAQATARQNYPAAPEQELVCAVDRQRMNLAGVLSAQTYQQIENWATLNRGQLYSLRPAWATTLRAKKRRIATEHFALPTQIDSTSPVYIDFIAPRAWKKIWGTTATIVCFIALSVGLHLWQENRSRNAWIAQAASINAQQKAETALRQKKTNTASSVRSASERTAKILLHRDFNKLFDVLENDELRDARLTQLSFDATNGQAHLSYELNDLAQSDAVSKALNSSAFNTHIESRTSWQLERLSTASSHPNNLTPTIKVQGFWRGQVD
jgi:hypothetical protein